MKKNTISAVGFGTAQEPIVHVGLDVHKRTIYLAARLGNTWLLEKVFDAQNLAPFKKALKDLAKHGKLCACYEASGAGFKLHRTLSDWGIACDVIAPSLIPTKAGEKKKCDRLDARKLAQYLASGLLTSIRIPTLEEEADRDLVRCRFTFRKEATKAKHRILKFLARKGREYFQTAWSEAHWQWLDQQAFELKSDQFTYRHYVDMLRSLLSRLTEVDSQIRELSKSEPYRDSVRVLRGFRGVDTLTAMVFLTELGDLNRFGSPRHLMAYLGLVPSLHQSGDTRREGSITKAGNSHVRHVLVQATWNYSGRPSVGKLLRHRQKDLPAWAIEQSSTAQKRIHKRLQHLTVTRGKCVAVVAGARELAGFLWAAMKTLRVRQGEGFSLPDLEIEVNQGGRPKGKSRTTALSTGHASTVELATIV